MATLRRVSGPYSIDLLASDVLDLLDQLAIRKVHFLGMSLGGTIGWMLAASYPERIASLVLCDTPIEAAPEVWATRITHGLVTRHGAVGRADP